MQIDFRHYVEERAGNYTPRPWLFDEIAGWLRDPGASRHFLITGEPGSGKTAASGHAWLTSTTAITAHHFCFARDTHWIDPNVFARSISAQLAAAIPRFDEARLEPYARELGTTNVTISVAGPVTGRVTGVDLASYEAEPETAFSRLVRDPLEALYARGFDRDIVILVDALDEARQFSGKINIADLLTRSAGMPRRVRLLLTARPDHELVARLRLADPSLRHLDLSDPSVRAKASHDVERHVARSVAEDDAIRARLGGVPEPQLVSTLAAKADGNFLWARFALIAIREQEGPLTLAELAALPPGLHAFYLDFLRRITADFSVLGTLAVAQEELTEGQLAAYTGMAAPRLAAALNQVRQFLDAAGPPGARTYAIYHRSFVDFLLGPAAGEYAVLPLEQHRRIADAWLHQVGDAETPRWDQSDDYALRHISAHLHPLRHEEPYASWEQRLVCREWQDLKHKRLRTDASFVTDVARAVDAAAEVWPRRIVDQIRGIAVLAAVRARGDLPDRALALLVRLGRQEEAIGFAELRPEPADAWIAIAEALLEEDAAAAETFARRAVVADPSKNEGLRILGRALSRLGRFAQAKEIVESPRLRDELSLRETLAKDAAAAGELELAMGVAGGIDDEHAQGVVRTEIAALALAQARGKEAAMINRLLNLDLTGFERIGSVAVACAENGEDDRAMAIANALTDKDVIVRVRKAQVERIARTNGAEEIAAWIADAPPEERAELAGAIVTALMAASRLPDAVAVLQRAEDRGRALDAMFAAAKGKGVAEIAALLDATHDVVPDAVLMSAVFHETVLRGDIASAWMLARRISDPALRERAARDLVRAALKHGDAKSAGEIWQELAPEAEAPEELILAIASAGQLDVALELLRRQPGSWEWRKAAPEVAIRLVAASRIQEAVALALTDAPDWASRDVALATVVEVAQHVPEQLADVFAWMFPKPLSEWDLKDAAVTLAERGDVAAAVRVARLSESHRIQVLAEAILDRLEAGDSVRAVALGQAVRDILTSEQQLNPGNLDEAIEALARHGAVEEALALVAAARRAEWQLVVAEALAETGDRVRAEELLAEGLAKWSAASAKARVAYVYVRLGRMDRAEELCGALPREGTYPDPILLRALAACGRADEALAMCSTDPARDRNNELVAIAEGLVAREQFEEAKTILGQTEKEVLWDRHTKTALVDIAVVILMPLAAADLFIRIGAADKGLAARLARSGSMDHAAALATHAELRHDGLAGLFAAAAGASKLREAVAAVAQFEVSTAEVNHALERARVSVGDAYDAALLAELTERHPEFAQSRGVEQLVEAGDLARAMQLAMRIENEHARVRAAAHVVAAVAERDGVDEAFRFAREDEPTRREVLEEAAGKLAEKGSRIAADFALAFAKTADRPWRLQWVADQFAKRGDLEGASRIADSFRGYDRDSILRGIIATVAEREPNRALDLAANITATETRMSALADVAIGHVKRGEAEHGVELATSTRLSDASPNDLTFIAVALFDAGRRDLGEKLLDHAIVVAESVTDRWRRNAVFASLSGNELDRGAFAAANALAASILPASFYRADVTLLKADKLAAAGRKAEARAAIAEGLLLFAGGGTHSARWQRELDAAAALIALDGLRGVTRTIAWCREQRRGAERIRAFVQIMERPLARARWIARIREMPLASAAEAELANIESGPERPIALSWLALLRSRRGRRRKAIAAARQAAEYAMGRPPSATRAIVLSNAAFALRRAGEKDEARAITGELLRSLPDIREWDEARDAGEALAFLADVFRDGKLAVATVAAARRNKNKYVATEVARMLAQRLQSEPTLRTTIAHALIKDRGPANLEHVIAILQCAAPDDDAVIADAERLMSSLNAKEQSSAVLDGAMLLARAGSPHAAHWIALAQSQEGPLAAAKIANAQSESGLQQDALATLSAVFRDARPFDREQFFEVLDAALPVLRRIDDGETLSRIAHTLAESESWWPHRLVES